MQTQVCLMTLLGGNSAAPGWLSFVSVRASKAGCTVRTRMGGGGGPACRRRALWWPLYKASFLRAAAHWGDICRTGSLLRMWTVGLLLFLAASSPSLASKCRRLKCSRLWGSLTWREMLILMFSPSLCNLSRSLEAWNAERQQWVNSSQSFGRGNYLDSYSKNRSCSLIQSP